MALTRAERETLLRFDDQEPILHAFTASPVVMRRWLRRGIQCVVKSRDRHGRPQSWGAVLPLECLRPLRPLGPDGRVARKRRGAPFGIRRLAPSAERTAGQ